MGDLPFSLIVSKNDTNAGYLGHEHWNFANGSFYEPPPLYEGGLLSLQPDQEKQRF